MKTNNHQNLFSKSAKLIFLMLFVICTQNGVGASFNSQYNELNKLSINSIAINFDHLKDDIGDKNLKKSKNKAKDVSKLNQSVSSRFDDESIEDGAKTIKINVSFTIEKNGDMTNIKVENSTNIKTANEAIRVLKSLKTKWEPMHRNNEPVKTDYILPIVLNCE